MLDDEGLSFNKYLVYYILFDLNFQMRFLKVILMLLSDYWLMVFAKKTLFVHRDEVVWCWIDPILKELKTIKLSKLSVH
ncbi:hypothetical protein BJB63x_001060 [Bartonella sp. JB63]|nr:hypothetical protein BJB15x_001080 [Bartonella sp. JB15]AQX28806.1 hypothetical protein BJB63x_001060 [Bartonella sp. JB63]